MTVKTGTAWAGTFVTLDSTGALAAGTPSGVLYVDGVANGATVTISGSNPYKWSVTLPALTAGQRVDMYITATIAGVSTAGFVASEQADTALTSEVKTETAAILADTGTDGVKIASGELSTVATAASITALDGKIDTIDNFLDTEVAAILADTDELQAELADGGRTDLLIDAIKAKTDVIPASPAPANEYDARMTAIQADLDNPNQYKADVSALATAAALDAVDNFIDTEITTIDGIVDAIKLKTDLIPATPAQAGEYTAAITAIDDLVDDLESRLTAARAGYLDNLNSGVALTSAGIDAILDEAVVGSYTMRQLLKVLAAKIAGKATGGGTPTITYRGVDDTSDVIIETVDANGNRSNMTLTV